LEVPKRGGAGLLISRGKRGVSCSFEKVGRQTRGERASDQRKKGRRDLFLEKKKKKNITGSHLPCGKKRREEGGNLE